MTAEPGEPTPVVGMYASARSGTVTVVSSRSEWGGAQDVRIPSRPRGVLTTTATCNTCGHSVTLRPGESIDFGDPRLCEHMGGPTSKSINQLVHLIQTYGSECGCAACTGGG